MKKLNLVVLSLAALAFGQRAGFCTANAAAGDPPEKDDGKKPTQGDRLAALEERLAQQDAELAQLRAASNVALPTALPGSLDLLLKGAGVEMKDVGWRIRAGLSHEQAVEVALNEKLERETAAAKAKEAKK